MKPEQIALRVVIGAGLLAAIYMGIRLLVGIGRYADPTLKHDPVTALCAGLLLVLATLLGCFISGMLIAGFCVACDSIAKAITKKDKPSPDAILEPAE